MVYIFSSKLINMFVPPNSRISAALQQEVNNYYMFNQQKYEDLANKTESIPNPGKKNDTKLNQLLPGLKGLISIRGNHPKLFFCTYSRYQDRMYKQSLIDSINSGIMQFPLGECQRSHDDLNVYHEIWRNPLVLKFYLPGSHNQGITQI